jgi:predicted transcriptional regulator
MTSPTKRTDAMPCVSDALASLVGQRRAEILRFLWSHGPATVRQIHAGLPGAAHLAYSTIASYCVDMTDKGLLDQRYADPGERLHERTTRVYSAAIAEVDLVRQAVAEQLDALVEFYEPQLEQGAIGLPDRYLLLAASQQQLRERRAADAMRQRRNFEYHLGLILPQQNYFAALQQSQPERVVMIAPADQEKTLEKAQTALQDVPPPLTPSQSLGVFHTLIAWLRTHEPSA